MCPVIDTFCHPSVLHHSSNPSASFSAYTNHTTSSLIHGTTILVYNPAFPEVSLIRAGHPHNTLRLTVFTLSTNVYSTPFCCDFHLSCLMRARVLMQVMDIVKEMVTLYDSYAASKPEDVKRTMADFIRKMEESRFKKHDHTMRT